MTPPRYHKEFKPSGAPWLGDVPAHWVVKPLWSMYRQKKITGHPEETLLSVYRDYGVIEKSSRADNKNRASEDLSGYQLVVDGDLVTNKMKTWQGSIAVSGLRGIVSPAYFVYAKLHDGNNVYLHHLLRSVPYVTGYQSISKGIRVGQWDLEADKFRLFPVLIPPRQEQDAIVQHLDRATTRIDALVAKKTRFIELLREKRQALITHAVTKGLDRGVATKDSNTASGLGLPKHWNVAKFWTVARQVSRSGHQDVGLMSVYLDRGVIPYSEGGGLVHKPSESLDSYQLVEPGNFVLNNQQAWRGSVGVSKHRGIVSPAYLVFELSKDLDPDFANYQFRETRFVDEMMFSSQGVGDIQRQVKWPLLRLAKVFLPPVEEQREIVAHLDRATTRIDTLIAKTERSIELLREHRTALITAAVTGKIDLRLAA